MNKLKTFWSWLIISSANPEKFALTAKGLLSLSIVQSIFNGFLPLIGINLSLDLSTLGDAIYSIVYYGSTAISSLAAALGFIRKLTNTIIKK